MGRFLDRPNRFLVRVALAGHPDAVEAHLPDPGRLRELLVPGARIWLQKASNPGRRTHWTAVLTEIPGGRGVVSVNTNLPNLLIAKALKEGAIEELADWRFERAEVPVGRSRLDFLLARPDGRQLALEVKSVTLVENGVALFPDAVTARGVRHLNELSRLARKVGWEAAVLFVLQRPDADRIEAARALDPAFADALTDARRAGVRVLGRRCEVTLERVTLGDPLPVARQDLTERDSSP